MSKILKGSEQYFKTPALMVIGETPSPRGKLSHAPTAHWQGRRLRVALEELIDAATRAQSSPCEPAFPAAVRAPKSIAAPEAATAPAFPPAPPREDREAFLRWEIAAALEVALPENGATPFRTPEPAEIAAALARVFPDSLCDTVSAARGEPPAEAMLEVSYDFELKCLMQRGLVDEQWMPAGLLWRAEAANGGN